MKSFLPFFTLFSFLLFVNTAVAARKDPGEYWRAVVKDQPLAEAVEALVEVDSTAKKPDCHTPATIEIQEEKILVKDFETKDIRSAQEKSFVKDFEPRPNISAYHDNSDKPADEKSFVKDFEPRPNISAYHGNGETKSADEKSFVNDFEPRPNISVYHD